MVTVIEQGHHAQLKLPIVWSAAVWTKAGPYLKKYAVALKYAWRTLLDHSFCDFSGTGGKEANSVGTNPYRVLKAVTRRMCAKMMGWHLFARQPCTL